MRSRRPATRRNSDGDQNNEDSFNLDTDENPDDERRGSPAPADITAGYSLADGAGGSTTATGASTTAAKLDADDNGTPTEPSTQEGASSPPRATPEVSMGMVQDLAEALYETFSRRRQGSSPPRSMPGVQTGSPTSYATGMGPHYGPSTAEQALQGYSSGADKASAGRTAISMLQESVKLSKRINLISSLPSKEMPLKGRILGVRFEQLEQHVSTLARPT